MKNLFYALMLALTLAAPSAPAVADSDDWRDGYWDHRGHGSRDRGQGWRHGRKDDGDSTDTGETEVVDEAADGHTGDDD